MHHSNDFYIKLTAIFKKHLYPNQHIALGVSWGADSMSILYSIQKYYTENKFDLHHIHVVHCNHHTRPETASEQELVHQVSTKNTYQVFDYSGTRYDENTLRQWRHQCFVDYCITHSITTLITGHHLDDRIESSLLNSSRWARRTGWLSIPLTSTHFLDPTLQIVRPLIDSSKSEIISYCHKHNISYATDSSNTNHTTSKRNLIRSFIQDHLSGPSRHTSFRRLYEELETQSDSSFYSSSNTPQSVLSIISRSEYDIVSITSWEWSAELLYKLYAHYTISLNPRSTTLTNLASQLNNKPGNKITYKGLKIISYRYATIVFRA